MKSKIVRPVSVQEPVNQAHAKMKLNGGLIANMIHRLWSEWRRYQLISDLEHKRYDEHFLNDVGLTRVQIDAEIKQLRRQKPI